MTRGFQPRSIAEYVNVCGRKIPMRTRSIAKAAKRAHKHDVCRRCEVGMTLQIYECPWGPHFHIGHPRMKGGSYG